MTEDGYKISSVELQDPSTQFSMRTVAFAALVASAAAFAPALSGVRTGATSLNMAMDKSNKAPEIVIMDHRGCSRKAGGEYTGAKAGDMNDEMCVKVSMSKVEGGSLNALSLLKK